MNSDQSPKSNASEGKATGRSAPTRVAQTRAAPTSAREAAMPEDLRSRHMKDLRISVTDRCNFRCGYCMPREVFGPDFPFLTRPEVLTFEEIARVTRTFVELGVEKVRLTGGEPLVRREIEKLISMLSRVEGIRDLTMTTNGSLLAPKADALAAAGLHRITVSLDALDDATFRAMSDVDLPVSRVLDGIKAAQAAGLGPVKVNMVVKRGENDQEILRMAEHFRGTEHILRFIEFMDVGTSNGWRMDDVVPAREIRDLIQTRWPIEPMEPNYVGEVANRYRYLDGAGEIGIIASVSQPFCAQCTRARITADGELFTCLFAHRGHDLRTLVRSGASDADLRGRIADVWRGRDDRYSEIRSRPSVGLPRVEMSRIGG